MLDFFCNKMDLAIVTPEEKNKVRQHFNVTLDQINENIEIIKTWLSKQPHLPQNLSDDFIEKLLLRNKFRVERTKEKLDNYFTLRGKYRYFLENWQYLRPSKEITTFLPMPKLTKNYERICVYKFKNPDPELFDELDSCKIGLAFAELTLRYDYSVGLRFLCDLGNYQMGHLLKFNPIRLTKAMALLEHAHSYRILGLEYINLPPFMNKIMAVLKIIFPEKIYKRITFHENMESVYKVIPKENLSLEYGGTSGSMNDLLNKWDKVFIENEKFFLENCENVSREQLRLSELDDDDTTFGVPLQCTGYFQKVGNRLINEIERNS